MVSFIVALLTLSTFAFHTPSQTTQAPEIPEFISVTPKESQESEVAIISEPVKKVSVVVVPKPVPVAKAAIPDVPFYSQFTDIQMPEWRKVGCGIASLAMLIDFYKPDTVSVNTLLKQGIASGAYLKNAGWTYKGLIDLSKKYGLDGKSYDLGTLTSANAFAQFKNKLKDGPVIASVHYKFDPKSTIPHLVVIDGIDGNTIHYNDPAATGGDKEISVDDFLKAWKKRFIVVRPV